MRVGVLSDSHGDLKASCRAVRLMGEIQLLIHAGDYYRDAEQLARYFRIPFQAVTGNCDFGLNGPKEKVFDLGEKRVFLTHGHQYQVKNGLLSLYYRSKEVEAAMVIFGHTHMPENQQIKDVQFLNPGSVARPCLSRVGTYAIIECTESLQAKIYNVK